MTPEDRDEYAAFRGVTLGVVLGGLLWTLVVALGWVMAKWWTP